MTIINKIYFYYNIIYLLYNEKMYIAINLFHSFFVLRKVYVEYCITVLLYVERNQDIMLKMFEKLYKYFPKIQM